MNPKQTMHAPAPGLTLSDIYYILFRHKWLIAILSIVFIIAAACVKAFWHLPYESEAKLLIKYVKEIKPPEQSGPDAQVMSTDAQGGNIINSEMEILTSMDLANSVADVYGPTKILAKAGGGTNQIPAAILIRKGLKVDAPLRSDVITLTLSMPDPDIVQPVLSLIITNYLKRHIEIHSPEFNDFLTRETDTLKYKLDQTEASLREAKSKANVMLSVEISKQAINDLMTKFQDEIYQAEADYAGYGATIKEMQKLVPASSVITSAQTTQTNSTNVSSSVAPVPSEKLADYRKLCQQLTTLEADGQELLRTYTESNFLVLNNQARIDSVQAQKKKLEDQYPGLVSLKMSDSRTTSSSAPSGPDPMLALNEEIIKADALAARIKVLTNRMAEIRNNAAALQNVEPGILELQHKKDEQQAQLTYYQRRLEEVRVDESFTGNANISEVESPTPPALDSIKLNKVCFGILFGGLALAFGLPFGYELYLDRTFKRPGDVQNRIKLPFFISVPYLNGNGRARALKKAKAAALLTEGANGATEVLEPGGGQAPASGSLALWDQHNPGLQPFYETLRDRLMTYFEVINLTHKPKLVAVTSCSDGAGVTSTAAGLASTLSETGEGNVLLVNMNARDGEAHHFYKGKLNCGLDEVFEKGTREGALLQGNLYVAEEHAEDERLPRVLPKRFSHLLPKMKASDFDYIIFDMPPVTQISITPRLARFMDMVLLVIESGKTDRDVAQRAAAALADSKTNVGVVLNKSRSYGPRSNHQDI